MREDVRTHARSTVCGPWQPPISAVMCGLWEQGLGQRAPLSEGVSTHSVSRINPSLTACSWFCHIAIAVFIL